MVTVWEGDSFMVGLVSKGRVLAQILSCADERYVCAKPTKMVPLTW